jgi:hypothetical protein
MFLGIFIRPIPGILEHLLCFFFCFRYDFFRFGFPALLTLFTGLLFESSGFFSRFLYRCFGSIMRLIDTKFDIDFFPADFF